MKVTDLFTVARGQSLDLVHLDQVATDTGIAYVSTAGVNNGVIGWVKPVEAIEPSAPGTISVALVGMTLSAFVQPRAYYTAQNVDVLTPIDPAMSFGEKIWWAQCIRANRYRFNYGRKANRTFRSLELPDTVPEWIGSIVHDATGDMIEAIEAVDESIDNSEFANFADLTMKLLKTPKPPSRSKPST